MKKALGLHRAATLWRALGLVLAGLGFSATPVSAATQCTVSSTVTADLGSYSPAAVKTPNTVPALQARAGLNCPTAVLTLLGGNYIRATFSSQNYGSQNGFLLVGPSASVSYIASADSGGTVQFGQGTTVDYMQNNLLNLLGLLGGSNADLPFFIKPASGSLLPIGDYKDKITINWAWYQCPGIGIGGLCIGTIDQGTGKSVIDVTLHVAARNVTLTVSTVTTWDKPNGTSNPKSLPGSKRRNIVTVANPDIVALDNGSLSFILPTPSFLIPALDGDGASSTAAIAITEGSPASGVALTYSGPASTTDDVEFSADNGNSWNFVPIAGDTTSEGQITHIRVKPRNAMARQSTFNISVAYEVR